MNPGNHQNIEDGINAVWGVKDVIDTLIWRYMDHPKPMTEDEMWNHLYSISCLLDLHCEKLMDTYCKVFQLNDYASDEVKERRAQILQGLIDLGGSQPKAKKVKRK
jgi:hypothetical protein